MKDDVRKNRNWKADLLPYLPREIAAVLVGVDRGSPLTEIRVRAGSPVQLCFAGYERLVPCGADGNATTALCAELLERLCEHSVHACDREMEAGFLTIPGGYRVGLCGRVSRDENGRMRLADVASFNIRIARACAGAAERLLPCLLEGGKPLSALIVSRPGGGKTTLLRELARACSYGLYGARPQRVCVVDTRFELAGAGRGIPQLDLGPRTDVLSGVSRAEGMRMMTVNMAPDVLVTDEIGGPADALAVEEAIQSGAAVFASAHAADAEALLRRHALRRLLTDGAFSRIALIGAHGAGSLDAVLDGRFHRLNMREENECCGFSR